MDFKDAEKNSQFIRLDVAAIVFVLFISAIVVSFLGSIGGGLIIATVSFVLVGFSVSRKWNRELAKNDMIELHPFSGVLAGGVMIAILQSASAYIVLGYPLLLAIAFGFAAGLGYDALALFISFYGLPGENYRTRQHPQREDDTTLYVFNDEFYISMVEENALKKQNEQTDESTDSDT